MTLLSKPTDRFAVTPSAFFERVHNEAVILDTAHELYLALNESGTCIWDVVARGDSVEDAARCLADRFDIPLDRARQDTTALIEQLIDRGLIVRKG